MEVLVPLVNALKTSSADRRDFLTGRLLQQIAAEAALRAGESGTGSTPTRGPTLLLQTTAMACHFDVILNPDGPPQQVEAASAALDLVHELEQVLTVYRPDAELATINRVAPHRPIEVTGDLFDLLVEARNLVAKTDGGFDPTTGPLIAAWRLARDSGRLPTESELAAARALSGMEQITFDAAARTLQYAQPGVELNLGAIGKGYAVDRAGALLTSRGIDHWLVHGGKSSVLAKGDHAGCGGWPVGLRDPLIPQQAWGTILLKNQALGTSGTAAQGFRLGGRRFGHILDPRTGWPVEGMLSVSVLTERAALADALSTAFFVLGVEKTRHLCDNSTDVGVLLFTQTSGTDAVEATEINIPQEILFPTRPLA
ncbi:MAG: hypothetical protein C0478_12330 [Planctomyces sp.]|nr:hypothetical protein [Planctomyces sp.]